MQTNRLSSFIYALSLSALLLIHPFLGSFSFAQSSVQSSDDPYRTGPCASIYTSPRQTSAATPYQAPFGLRQSTAGAIAGALLGAAGGALVGHATDDPGPGAAIGAGLGAVSGYVIGRQIETRATALGSQQQILEQQRQELAHYAPGYSPSDPYDPRLGGRTDR